MEPAPPVQKTTLLSVGMLDGVGGARREREERRTEETVFPYVAEVFVFVCWCHCGGVERGSGECVTVY
jgi:hypothetical protein